MTYNSTALNNTIAVLIMFTLHRIMEHLFLNIKVLVILIKDIVQINIQNINNCFLYRFKMCIALFWQGFYCCMLLSQLP